MEEVSADNIKAKTQIYITMKPQKIVIPATDSPQIFNGQLTVSSLKIAEVTCQNHGEVLSHIRRSLAYASVPVQEFLGSYMDRQNRTRPCYYLPRGAWELAIRRFTQPRRAAVWEYWHKLEGSRQIRMDGRAPKTGLELLESLAASVSREAEQLQLAITMLQQMTDTRQNATAALPPHAYREYFDFEAVGLLSIMNAAAALKTWEQPFVRKLLEKNVLYWEKGNLRAAEKFISAGYFEEMTSMINGSAFTVALFTQKGMKWVDPFLCTDLPRRLY